MIWLKYHLDENDYHMARFFYLINLLKEISEKVCRVELEGGQKVYFEIFRKGGKFAAKGLPTPKEAFGSGGRHLFDTLFLYRGNQVEYYWHYNLEKVLEEILSKGEEYLNILGS